MKKIANIHYYSIYIFILAIHLGNQTFLTVWLKKQFKQMKWISILFKDSWMRMTLSPISCNTEFKVWRICQTDSPGDSLSLFHRYKAISKRTCSTCMPQNPSLQGPAIGMREFSVSSTTEVNRNPFTDENEQRSGPPSYSRLVSLPCSLSTGPDEVVKQPHS